jgi:hypothetical protein
MARKANQAHFGELVHPPEEAFCLVPASLLLFRWT